MALAMQRGSEIADEIPARNIPSSASEVLMVLVQLICVFCKSNLLTATTQ